MLLCWLLESLLIQTIRRTEILQIKRIIKHFRHYLPPHFGQQPVVNSGKLRSLHVIQLFASVLLNNV